MRVNIFCKNPALISIIKDPSQIITLDANFLIPPYRTGVNIRPIEFSKFESFWLRPIFSAFPNLAIHEAVLDELTGTSIQMFIQPKLNCTPPKIIIHRDSSLNDIESILRDTFETRIAYHTNYEPIINNKDDRGEVKSLAFIAVKGLLYFAAHDNNAIQLIEKSEEWFTGLDHVEAIQMYELIYYLYKFDFSDKQSMKMLYKYQYYLTEREKSSNPNWIEFLTAMDRLYGY